MDDDLRQKIAEELHFIGSQLSAASNQTERVFGKDDRELAYLYGSLLGAVENAVQALRGLAMEIGPYDPEYALTDDYGRLVEETIEARQDDDRVKLRQGETA